jgi:hypothetical protein
MHLDRVTVTDLIQALEGCDPDAEARLAQQPAWPLEYAGDSANAAVQVELDGTSVVYLGRAPSSASSATPPAAGRLVTSPTSRGRRSQP